MSVVSTVDPRIGETIQAFEAATVKPGEFSHEAHIKVAWGYLQQHDQLESINRFTAAIKRLTQKLGVPEKYHETITWFYLLKIADRCTRSANGDWHAFRTANPDLFEWNPSIVQKYYSEDLLSSETARRRFVLPDLNP